MTALHRAIPNPDDLLALEPEALGGVILSVWNELQQNGMVHAQALNYFDLHRGVEDRRGQRDAVEKALNEAFIWLKLSMLIVPEPGVNGQNGFCILSRRGRRVLEQGNFVEYRRGSLLSRDLLHPRLAEAAWPMFVAGNHDAAVLQSYIEVEVAVRRAGRYGDDEIGVDLMRRAFGPDNGPLTDREAPMSERQALQNLFAGAIGSYKNPLSHRRVGLDASKGSAEMIILASHLLNIVDQRAAVRR